MLLLQKNEAKSKPGSRRSMRSNLNPALLSAPMTHQPRRQLMSPIRHTRAHEPPHHTPRRATQPHCRDSRRATPHATSRHTTRHDAPHRHTVKTHNAPHHAPRVVLSALTISHSRLQVHSDIGARPAWTRAAPREVRILPVDNRWKTCG